jgi:phage protein D
MFNYITVSFPNTTLPPVRVYNVSLKQNRYQHEVATIQFRDWGVDYDNVSSGSPITFTINNGLESKVFIGYIDHVTTQNEPGSNITEVVAISASYVFKNESQKVYKGLSADAIIQQIAAKHSFSCYAIPHPRVYPQVSQAGHTDWEFCVRLAKQSGYSLRTEGTEIYFQPMMYDYTQRRSQAKKFTMRSQASPSGSNLYSFYPVIGESIDHDGDKKAAISVSGVDLNTSLPVAIVNQKRNKNTRLNSKAEFFDKFHTHVVALDSQVANHEAKAADDRTVFPYRAVAEVIGDPSLRPDLPLYLDGLGNNYSGYWIILGTEHLIVEESRNVFKYTTLLHLGIDSLGPAVKWTDGALISSPDYAPSRTIIPGVRQTNKPPTSALRRTSIAYSPAANGQFSAAKNKPLPLVNKQPIKGPKWTASKPAVQSVTQPNTSSASYTKRLLTKVPKP